MNTFLFQQMLTYVADLPILEDWAEPRAFVNRIATAKPSDWLLPIVTCEAVGGAKNAAIPAMAAIALLQLSIILVDDILDEDPRGEHLLIGVGAASNQALALQAASHEAITYSSLSPQRQLASVQKLNQMALKTAFGQHLDTHLAASETNYWQLVANKSCPYFSLAFFLGAVCGGAELETSETFAKLGAIYGEIIQIQDDMSDVMATPVNPDWLQERLSLPILFAQSVDHPQKTRFLQLRSQILDPDALAEAQQIIVSCGAVSYCIDQVLQRYQKVQAIISNLEPAQAEVIFPVFTDLVEPIYDLFEDFDLPKPINL